MPVYRANRSADRIVRSAESPTPGVFRLIAANTPSCHVTLVRSGLQQLPPRLLGAWRHNNIGGGRMRFVRLRRRARVAIVVAAGASALGLAGPAWADKAAETCRGSIATSLAGVIKAGLKDTDGCHKAQDKAAAVS